MSGRNASLAADDSAENQLIQAYEAFQTQRYEQARLLFDSVARMHKTGPLNQHARYGIACVQMATSETADAMKEAMREWAYWFQLQPKKYTHGDPRLLDPVLHRYGIYLQNDAQQAKKWQAEKKWFQQALTQKQSQIEVLQEKIDAIEAIDQDIEEKKRKITPPNPEVSVDNP